MKSNLGITCSIFGNFSLKVARQNEVIA